MHKPSTDRITSSRALHEDRKGCSWPGPDHERIKRHCDRCGLRQTDVSARLPHLILGGFFSRVLGRQLQVDGVFFRANAAD